MAQDRLHVVVSVLGSDFEVGNPEAVHPVGVSHLREYFDHMVGDDVPHESVAQWHSREVLGSLTALSTDPRLHAINPDDPFDYVPKWLSLAEPAVSRIDGLGRYATYLLDHFEDAEVSVPQAQDIQYSVGLFDISSYVVAMETGIEHPRLRDENLMERVDGVKLDDQFSSAQTSLLGAVVFELLANYSDIDQEYKQRMQQLRVEGQAIVELAVRNAARLHESLREK